VAAGSSTLGHHGPVARPTLAPAARDELEAILGSGLVTDADVVAGHAVDWTGRFRGASPALLRPASTAEVAAVIDVCRRHGVAVVPQGGNTGLVGGSVPMEGEAVLSLARIAGIGPIAELDGQVTVGAGATLADLGRVAREHGLRPPVDLAARDSATLGGMVATNAGGLHVVRHGPMRHHLTGHEAVTGTGAVLSHLAGLAKDNTGYDLGGLLCGSEGTLGVLTHVRIRLLADPPERAVALVGFDTLDAAVGAVATWRRDLGGLEAAEVVLRDGVELVLASGAGPDPFERPWPVYVLVEVAADDDPSSSLADALAATEAVGDAVVTAEPGPRARLWALREEHTTAINALGAPHKLDVTLPLDALAAVCAEVPRLVASLAPDARTWLFGHIGDGNVHVNVTGLAPDDERVDEAVLELVAGAGGSISAEHGIGRAKRRWLHLNRTEDEIQAFAALKRALDPEGILNPGVLLPPNPGG
jgi:FAD/FMN-containing dehydrogenase